MIKFCVRLVQRWLPEPFIFAILLTFVAAIVAMPLCRQTPLEVVEHWGDGVWNLLEFAMQMALVLVCGSTLAAAPVIKRGINAMARLPQSAPAAIALVTVVSALSCWLNWGFGLIVGVVFAKAIARQRSDVDYRLLVASAYSGFVVWHAGMSGSIPLTMATPGEALSLATNGALTDPVPVAQTILDWHNLVTVLLVIIGITIANTLMHPKKGVLTVDPALLKDDDHIPADTSSSAKTPAQRLEQSKLLSWLVALMLVAYLVIHLFVNGASLDLGGVIMIFLALGLMLHPTPVDYVRAFGKATTGAAGIILQFPFYAGIMGIFTGVGISGISLRPNQHARHLSVAHLPLRSCAQPVCTERRRSLGCTSAHYVHRRCQPRCRPGLDRHGHLVGRRMDQSHTTLLGSSGPGYCSSEREGHYGLLPH